MGKAKPAVPVIVNPLADNPDCRRCGLCKSSQTICCPSTGPDRAPVFFVGEALGGNEEELGRPFVGDAGQKLTYAINRAGLKRRDVRIGNVVRCRPPGNRQESRRNGRVPPGEGRSRSGSYLPGH